MISLAYASSWCVCVCLCVIAYFINCVFRSIIRDQYITRPTRIMWTLPTEKTISLMHSQWKWVFCCAIVDVWWTQWENMKEKKQQCAYQPCRVSLSSMGNKFSTCICAMCFFCSSFFLLCFTAFVIHSSSKLKCFWFAWREIIRNNGKYLVVLVRVDFVSSLLWMIVLA